MKKMFILGLALGMVGGALIVAKSKKAKELIDKGEESVKKIVKKAKKDQDKKSRKSEEEQDDKN